MLTRSLAPPAFLPFSTPSLSPECFPQNSPSPPLSPRKCPLACKARRKIHPPPCSIGPRWPGCSPLEPFTLVQTGVRRLARHENAFLSRCLCAVGPTEPGTSHPRPATSGYCSTVVSPWPSGWPCAAPTPKTESDDCPLIGCWRADGSGAGVPVGNAGKVPIGTYLSGLHCCSSPWYKSGRGPWHHAYLPQCPNSVTRKPFLSSIALTPVNYVVSQQCR